jgi:hypothetical protein
MASVSDYDLQHASLEDREENIGAGPEAKENLIT